jgi:hypothetical protein
MNYIANFVPGAPQPRPLSRGENIRDSQADVEGTACEDAA